MILKYSDIIDIYDALATLDGSNEISEGKVIEKTINVFSGKTKYKIVKNMRILKTYVTDFTKKRDEYIKELSGGHNSIPPEETKLLHIFNEKVSKTLDEQIDVKGLLLIKFDELRLDDEYDADQKLVEKGNKISNAAICNLGPLLDDDMLNKNE